MYTLPILFYLLYPLHLSCDNFSSLEVLPYEEMVQATIELAGSNNHVTGFYCHHPLHHILLGLGKWFINIMKKNECRQNKINWWW